MRENDIFSKCKFVSVNGDPALLLCDTCVPGLLLLLHVKLDCLLGLVHQLRVHADLVDISYILYSSNVVFPTP